MTRLRLWLPLVVVVVASASAAARAQSSEADRVTARQLLAAGFDALDRKDYATAADRFDRANALVSAPTISLGLGRARLGLGKLVGAQDAFSRAATSPIGPTTSDAFRKAIADAHTELDALMPRIPSVVIQVRGAKAPTITLDEDEVPAASIGVPRPADPGRHVIRARAVGYVTGETAVTLAEGQTKNVVIELKPAEVVQATTPQPAASPIVLGSAGTGARDVTPPSPAGPKRGRANTIWYVVIGAGAAGLVVGGITGGLAIAKRNSFVAECGGTNHCASNLQPLYERDLDTFHALATTSTVAFLAGGALAAGGMVLWLTTPTPASSSVHLTPMLGPGYLGASGRF